MKQNYFSSAVFQNYFQGRATKHKFANSLFTAIAILFLLGTGTACEPKETPSPNLIFDIPVTISPQREIYKVGDTIWIDIDFPKVLTDTSGLYSFNFKDFNFAGGLRFLKLTDKNLDQASQPGGLNFIKINNLKGQIEVLGGSGAALVYSFDNERYSIKSSMILKNVGVYSMVFITSNSHYNPEYQRSWKVNNQIINIGNLLYQVNRGGSRNTHLIFENTTNNWDETVWPNNLHFPFYTFKVE
jgi:hypothetical protein